MQAEKMLRAAASIFRITFNWTAASCEITWAEHRYYSFCNEDVYWHFKYFDEI